MSRLTVMWVVLHCAPLSAAPFIPTCSGSLGEDTGSDIGIICNAPFDSFDVSDYETQTDIIVCNDNIPSECGFDYQLKTGAELLAWLDANSETNALVPLCSVAFEIDYCFGEEGDTCIMCPGTLTGGNFEYFEALAAPGSEYTGPTAEEIQQLFTDGATLFTYALSIICFFVGLYAGMRSL